MEATDRESASEPQNVSIMCVGEAREAHERFHSELSPPYPKIGRLLEAIEETNSNFASSNSVPHKLVLAAMK
jgi:hypothetical protein